MDLSDYDSLKVELMVRKGKKINFERAGDVFMVVESELLGGLYGVFSAEYLSNGMWVQDKRIPLKKKK